MNKYIKSDLEQSITYMKSAIMNALHNIESDEEVDIEMSKYLSPSLLRECLKSRDWNFYDEDEEFTYYVNPDEKYLLIDNNNFTFYRGDDSEYSNPYSS